MELSPSIFKAYDIRGVIDKTLDPSVAELIGQSFGSAMREIGETVCVVGRDGRLSGPALMAGLTKGLLSVGVDVIDLGVVATPMVYFGTNIKINGQQAKSGIMITGSHNPPDYNGFKMVLGSSAIYGEQIQALRERIIAKQFATGLGKRSEYDIFPEYLARIVGDVKLQRKIKIAVDCGNGVGGAFAGKLFRALGCEVEELFCEVDGTFPNHHPDPAHLENLQDLIKNLKNTDNEIGLAFDGDADRLGVVTKSGEVIFPDRQMMLFAKDVLGRNPGAQIIYDVKCTRNLATYIKQAGGEPLMWKTGHSLVKAKLKETGAPLAGEMSGHIFFKDRWYGFDDGLYTGARLLEILSGEKDLNATLEGLPNAICTPELQMPCAEGEPFVLLDKIKEKVAESKAKGTNTLFPSSESINTIDGVRVEYADGFGLARPSNTTPIVVMRFEADSQAAIERIQAEFKQVFLGIKSDVKMPF
jgi:phosphomannomutase / phosphoglucomutase